MKKLIAILTIAIVLVGMVFAADGPEEKHTLTITATSAMQAPAFMLGIGTVYSNNTTPAAYNDEATSAVNYTGSTGTLFDFEDGGTVTVVAYLVNNAKIYEQYKLTFSGGNFAVKKNHEDVTISPVAESNKITSVGSNITGIDSITYSDLVAHVNFNGSRCTADTSSTGKVALATATYVYAADPAVDPGTYTADIVLTIVSE